MRRISVSMIRKKSIQTSRLLSARAEDSYLLKEQVSSVTIKRLNSMSCSSH